MKNPRGYIRTIKAGSNFKGANRIEFGGVVTYFHMCNVENQGARVYALFNDDPLAQVILHDCTEYTLNSNQIEVTSVDFKNNTQTDVEVCVFVGIAD